MKALRLLFVLVAVELLLKVGLRHHGHHRGAHLGQVDQRALKVGVLRYQRVDDLVTILGEQRRVPLRDPRNPRTGQSFS